jgi:hypothetical protein
MIKKFNKDFSKKLKDHLPFKEKKILVLSATERKIKQEKRKRFQIYTSLDYLLSMVSYFDFFSLDAFKLLISSKDIAKLTQNDSITVDCLLLSFLQEKCQLVEILKASNLTIENLFHDQEGQVLNFFFPNCLSQVKKKIKRIPQNLLNTCLSPFLSPLGLKVDKKKLIYAPELLRIFEQAVENSLLKFKTPIITPEILFLTLMEDKNSSVGKRIRKVVGNKIEFYLLKYKLLKILHQQETFIKNKVTKNQLFFAYLLKSQLSDYEFNRLSENDFHSLGTLVFRSKLINLVLNSNIPFLLEKEIMISMKNGPKRSYSS